jgi:hypothetical protein
MERKYIYNRDGASLWFEQVDTNEYILNVDEKHKYVLEYACMNYESVPDNSLIFDCYINGKKGLYHSFDPSGGPYICLGYDTGFGKVKRIYESHGQIRFVIDT